MYKKLLILVGSSVGTNEGLLLGSLVGISEGLLLGSCVGIPEGLLLGSFVGISEGLCAHKSNRKKNEFLKLWQNLYQTIVFSLL